MITQIEIIYETRRCSECGTHWAIEKFRCFNEPKCPVCAQRKSDQKSDLISSLTRSVNALRGVITKLKSK